MLVQVTSNLGLLAYGKLRASEAVALGGSRFDDFQLPVGQHRNSSQASQRDLAISNLNRESQQLREVRAALRRITEGSFGVCEQCGEDIHSKRLAAIPWTALCIECQEMLDRHRREKQIPIYNPLSSVGT